VIDVKLLSDARCTIILGDFVREDFLVNADISSVFVLIIDTLDEGSDNESMEGECEIVSLEISVDEDEMLVSENVEVDVTPWALIGKLEETDVAVLLSTSVEFSILVFVVLVRVDLFNDTERCESDPSSKEDN